jgi:16S rRNA (guanine527-N7)-methyltransferase
MRYNPDFVTLDYIRELLIPFLADDSLSSSQLQSISDYLDLLLRWNARVNLTAVRDPSEIVQRHFGESLFAARHALLHRPPNFTAIDIGSGAGFPGLALKIWWPELRLTLIESNNKKVAFLREVVRTLKLESVEVLAQRAQEVVPQADLVTLRAVEKFDRVLPVSRRLMLPKAELVLLIGADQVAVAKSAVPEVVWDAAIPLPLSQSRVLLIGRAER